MRISLSFAAVFVGTIGVALNSGCHTTCSYASPSVRTADWLHPDPEIVQIMPADWKYAANEFVRRLDASGLLDEEPYRPDGEPVVFALGDLHDRSKVLSGRVSEEFALSVIRMALANSPRADVSLIHGGSTLHREGGMSWPTNRDIGLGVAARPPALWLRTEVFAESNDDPVKIGRKVSSWGVTFVVIDVRRAAAVFQTTVRVDIRP